MTLKVAILIAAGRPDTTTRERLTVSPADGAAAIVIAERWRTDAIRFASRIGESEFEQLVQRCLRVFRAKGGSVGRRIIAQGVHLSKRLLDDVEATLVDRGDIAINRVEASGRPTLVTWVTPGA